MRKKLTSSYLSHYEKALDCFIFRNDTDKAIREYKKVIRLNPEYAQAYYDLGFIYSLKNSKKSSVKYFENYLALNPFARDRDEVSSLIDNIKSKKREVTLSC